MVWETKTWEAGIINRLKREKTGWTAVTSAGQIGPWQTNPESSQRKLTQGARTLNTSITNDPAQCRNYKVQLCNTTERCIFFLKTAITWHGVTTLVLKIPRIIRSGNANYGPLKKSWAIASSNCRRRYSCEDPTLRRSKSGKIREGFKLSATIV